MATAENLPNDLDAQMDEHTFTIPEPNEESFRKRIEKLNKRAKKLGVAPLVAAKVDEFETRTVKKIGRREVEIVRRYVKVMLTGERPKLHGWTMLGTVEHDTGAGHDSPNILRNAPGKEIPESYRNAPNFCDHCKTRRRRRDTFVIEKDGEIRQIGRNCLQDFIGDVNVKGIAWYYELWHNPSGFVPSGDNTSKDYVELELYMAAVAATIREHGFVSRTAAWQNESVRATADIAWIVMHPKAQTKFVPRISVDDYDAAADIIEWCQNDLGKREGLTGYLANLAAATAGGWMRVKNSGLAASAFRARENDLEDQRKVEARRQAAADRRAERVNRTNEHFGNIGDNVELELRVLACNLKEGRWGDFYSITMLDDEGRMFYCATSSDPDLDRGNTYKVKGTIKDHKVWTAMEDGEDDPRVTVLNRCKFAAV